MRPETDKALLIKYLEGNCTAEERQQVAHYLANAEYPERFDELLEDEWASFKAPDATRDDPQLDERLFHKFNSKIDPEN